MLKENFKKILKSAGIEINGDRPWDMLILDERVYRTVALRGLIGLGDAYINGWWECKEIDSFFYKALTGSLNEKVRYNISNIGTYLREKIFNLQSESRAFIVGQKHYDLGNDLYELMLDKRMVYTCGYWKGVSNLDDAQEAKLDLVCRKINLKAGQKVLDIGCGWGSFAKFAAEKYGAHVVGVTVSKEQVELAKKRCEGFPVGIRLQDYRDVNEKFDHIVSLGMFEHVGYKNYKEYFKVAHRCLKDEGFFLLQTMGQRDDYPNTHQPEAHWIIKHIFPNGMLPSVGQIGKAAERLFVMEDWHTFGKDYDKTMMAWFKNFDQNWPKLEQRYGKKFYRMWKYYLLSFCGAWRAHGQYNLWQIVFTKPGKAERYQSIR
ncbi:MAG: cyclopropane fatty acyl phospholipid synthase [Patescibacteria group bacterium]